MFHAFSAVAAGGVDLGFAADQIAEVEQLLESGMSRRGQAMARSALSRAVLVSGDLDRAIVLCDQTLEVTKDDPRSRLRLGAFAIRAEALALQNSPDTDVAFLDAIEPAVDLGWWGQLWRILVPLARWWTATGNRPAAAHIVGCADANTITVAGLDQLADSLSDPDLLAARQQGAQMSHTELLDHVIAELAPVAARGTIGRWPGGST